jgi:hypothetical protein
LRVDRVICRASGSCVFFDVFGCFREHHDDEKVSLSCETFMRREKDSLGMGMRMTSN